MTNADEKRRTINARPTKELFIEMLVRDITLGEAVIDLVDNCVDGAIRLRGEGPYEGLEVDVDASDAGITIVDNCGGISAEAARDYAFRFGRSERVPLTPGSLGHVGVGMKRAFFKLGNKFCVESTAENSRFVVNVDVREWRRDEEDWNFRFEDIAENLPETPVEERGTTVSVTDLHPNVSGRFRDEAFIDALHRDLQAREKLYLEKKLSITLNGIPLAMEPLRLYQSHEIRPANREMSYGSKEPSVVKVRMWAGIGKSSPPEAGWYVFCNGRMVVEADQTMKTGWGERGGKLIPKYHNQFAMFRGFVFFFARDARMLPWNTAKTDVNTDADTYRTVRLEMIKTMRPVIDFLNKLDAAKDQDTDRRPLQAAIDSASLTALAETARQETFVWPRPTPQPAMPKKGRISYTKPLEDIDVAKRRLKVKTHREVGEKTFDYFFVRECEE